MYRKPTHTDRYLNAQYHHHPTQIQAVANTLISRSLRLTDKHGQSQELDKITNTLRQNGYKDHTIKKAIQRTRNTQSTEEPAEKRSRLTLPYIKGTTDRIGRLLRRHNLATAYKPHKTIGSSIRNPKDKRPLENQGVYSIQCSNCDGIYVGQSNRRISARVDEHKLAIRNKLPTSALSQHEVQTGHKIDLDSCREIASVPYLRTRLIRESIEIEKQGSLNKRDDALNLPPAWKLLIKAAKTTVMPNNLKTKPPGPTATAPTRRAGPPATDRYALRPRGEKAINTS